MINLSILSSTDILALTIIGEARGEPIEGQVAVGCVIRNRLHSNKFGRSYHDVCLAPNQFSCWDASDPNQELLMKIGKDLLNGHTIVDIHLRQCFYIANGIVHWEIKDNTKGSLNYLAKSLFNSDKRPKWARIPKNDPIGYGDHFFFSV